MSARAGADAERQQGPAAPPSRLRVAHELQRRPVLAHAFARGEVSYAKLKILTRLEGLGDECDRTLAASAAAGTVADTERMYQHYKLNRQQNGPPPDISRWDRCGIETINRNNGIATMELRVPDADEQRILHILDLMVKSHADGPVDKAPVEPPLTWTQRRTLALLDLLEAGLTHAAANGDVDPEAAVVNVCCDYDMSVERAPGSAELDGGYPIGGETARQLACDAGLVRIVTRGASEVLDIGRKTREWNTPQPRTR